MKGSAGATAMNELLGMRNRERQTPLHIAAFNMHNGEDLSVSVSVFERLLVDGVLPEVVSIFNGQGLPAFHIVTNLQLPEAAVSDRAKQMQILRLLLHRGAARDSSEIRIDTPLTSSVVFHRPDIAALILSDKAAAPDLLGRVGGSTFVLRSVLRNTFKDRDPVHAERDLMAWLEILLENGLDVNMDLRTLFREIPRHTSTPLLYAIDRNFEKLVEFLLDSGASNEVVTYDEGSFGFAMSPLFLACSAEVPNALSLSVIARLVTRRTLQHKLHHSDPFRTVPELLRSRTSRILFETNDETTPIMQAMLTGTLETVTMLIEKGAFGATGNKVLDKDVAGRNVLHFACESSVHAVEKIELIQQRAAAHNPELVAQLRDLSAAASARTRDDDVGMDPSQGEPYSPLSVAVDKGDPAVVSALLHEFGVPMYIRNSILVHEVIKNLEHGEYDSYDAVGMIEKLIEVPDILQSINEVDPTGLTPLCRAILAAVTHSGIRRRKCVEIATFLLDRAGADPNAACEIPGLRSSDARVEGRALDIVPEDIVSHHELREVLRERGATRTPVLFRVFRAVKRRGLKRSIESVFER